MFEGSNPYPESIANIVAQLIAVSGAKGPVYSTPTDRTSLSPQRLRSPGDSVPRGDRVDEPPSSYARTVTGRVAASQGSARRGDAFVLPRLARDSARGQDHQVLPLIRRLEIDEIMKVSILPGLSRVGAQELLLRVTGSCSGAGVVAAQRAKLRPARPISSNALYLDCTFQASPRPPTSPHPSRSPSSHGARSYAHPARPV